MTDIVIRASSLSGYADCPRRAAARLFGPLIEAMGFRLALRRPAHVGALIGSACHAAAAVALNEKMRSGSPDLRPAAAIDAAMATLHERAAEEGATFDDQAQDMNKAALQARRMSVAMAGHVARTVDPVAVEERLEATVAPGVVLSGQSDLLARDPVAVHDHKTGKRRGNNKPQVGAYALLAKSHGIPVEQAREHFVQRVALSKDQPPAATFEHNLAAAETAATNVLHRILADRESFSSGDPERGIRPGDPWAFLANPASMLCSPKFCPAWGTDFCHEHQKEEK